MEEKGGGWEGILGEIRERERGRDGEEDRWPNIFSMSGKYAMVSSINGSTSIKICAGLYKISSLVLNVKPSCLLAIPPSEGDIMGMAPCSRKIKYVTTSYMLKSICKYFNGKYVNAYKKYITLHKMKQKLSTL